MTPLGRVSVAVPEAEALSDRVWFNHNPNRRYRRRQSDGNTWIIRRRSGAALLRTLAVGQLRGVPDTDKALREVWVTAAWAELSPIERAKLARQIRREEKLYEL